MEFEIIVDEDKNAFFKGGTFCYKVRMVIKTEKNNINFLMFVTRFGYPSYNTYEFILYMWFIYIGTLMKQRRLKLKAVDRMLLKKLISGNNYCDLNNTVIVNDSNRDIHLKFATIHVQLNGHTLKRKVMFFTTNLQNNFDILVSYNLLHNLKGATDCFFKDCEKFTTKFADEVELSLISSPNEWSNFIVDHCLRSYFKTPKLLYKDDVIEINLNEYGKEVFHTSSKFSNVNEQIYFKCNKIFYKGSVVSGGYFCASDKSTVRQISNVQSFIPRRLYNFGENYEASSLYPDAFNCYFQDMKNAVYPFIKKKETMFKPIFLIEGRKGIGKSLLVQCISLYFGMHLYMIHNFDVSANVYAQNETKLRNILFGAKMTAPCILYIKNFENFGKNNEGQYDERIINHFTNELRNFFQGNDFPVILFCSCNEKNIPVQLKRAFLKTFVIKAPNEQEREGMLNWILKNEKVEINVNLNNVASKTHGFLFEDLKALVHYAVTDFYQEKADDANDNLTEKYFIKALDFMQSNYNESLGAPKVPKVNWSDVGGLNDVKEEIIKTIKLPLRHPHLLKQTGLKRSGILLFGPPGTGKTLIAKAVATECGLCFLSVKGPELLNMYVGQSEQNVREVFERAREASPCIIFFDELDSLAPNRGASGDSGGVMDRVVSQLLAEMDGLGHTGTIFIIGATNRPDLIDPALLRPGRFDKLLYVGPCMDKVSKLAVLQALTKKFNFSSKIIMEEVVEMCPENFSGADFYGICTTAWTAAVRRLVASIENGKNEEQKYSVKLEDVIVTLEDFKSAIKSIKPSIKQEDLEYFHRLKLDLK